MNSETPRGSDGKPGPANRRALHYRSKEPTWGLGEVALGFVVLVLLSLIVPSAYLYFSGRSGSAPETLGDVLASLACAWVAFIGTPIYATHKCPGGVREQLGLKFVLPVDLAKGLMVGLFGQAMVVVIYLPLHFLDPGAAKSVSNPAKELTQVAHGWRWIPFAISVAMVSPFAEELFFRGLTMRSIAKKWGPRAGIILSGVLFGLTHFEGIQTPALVIFGWILGWRATRTGRIGETIVAHGSFNAITLISLALGQ